MLILVFGGRSLMEIKFSLRGLGIGREIKTVYVCVCVYIYMYMYIYF